MDESKIPKTLDELPIKLFKLMNGESIISYTHNLDNEFCIGLEEPMSVKINSDSEFVLSPWMPFTVEEVHVLDNTNIVMDSIVDNDMKAQYMQIVLDNINDFDFDFNHSQIETSNTYH
jgi:hypothetical protein